MCLFADDTALYLTMEGADNSSTLQQDLDRLSRWEIAWDMEFNPSKCQVVQVTGSRNPISASLYSQRDIPIDLGCHHDQFFRHGVASSCHRDERDSWQDAQVFSARHCSHTLSETLIRPRILLPFIETHGLGGSVGCAVRLETRRSRVQPPSSVTFFRGDWSWNIFYGHSLPSADSRRAVVSVWRKNVHNTG